MSVPGLCHEDRGRGLAQARNLLRTLEGVTKGSSAASIRGSEGSDRLFQPLNPLQVLIDKKTDEAHGQGMQELRTRGGETWATGRRRPADRVNLPCRLTRRRHAT